MNPPDPSGPDGPPPRDAGTADGDLREADRPFNAANTEFWAAVEPPQPDEETWEAVRRRIAARLLPPAVPHRRQRVRRRAAAAVAAGIAVALLAGWLALDRHGPRPDGEQREPERAVAVAPMPRQVAEPDPLAEFPALELAGPADVLVEAVSGDAVGGMGADSPVPGQLPLAEAGDVTVVGIRPGPNGGMPRAGLTTGPGDAPMIYASR